MDSYNKLNINCSLWVYILIHRSITMPQIKYEPLKYKRKLSSCRSLKPYSTPFKGWSRIKKFILSEKFFSEMQSWLISNSNKSEWIIIYFFSTLQIQVLGKVASDKHCHTECGDSGCICRPTYERLDQLDHLLLLTETGQPAACLCGNFRVSKYHANVNQLLYTKIKRHCYTIYVYVVCNFINCSTLSRAHFVLLFFLFHPQLKNRCEVLIRWTSTSLFSWLIQTRNSFQNFPVFRITSPNQIPIRHLQLSKSESKGNIGYFWIYVQIYYYTYLQIYFPLQYLTLSC